jgi:tetratricopeptide (TPR) repeat protein
MAQAEMPFDAGDATLTQALAIADELSDPALRGHCLWSLCMNRFCWMHHEECAEAGLEAADLLRTAGDRWGLASVLGFIQRALVDVGRFSDALRIAPELEPLAERLGNHPALMQMRRARAMVDFCSAGDPAALEAFARADLEFVGNAGLPWVDHSHCWLGLARFLSGDWDGARGHFEDAVACETTICINGWDRALLFEYRAYAGDREAALAILDTVEDNRMPTPGQANGWGRWVMLLSAVEGLYVLGELNRAAELYDLVVECITRTRAVCPNFNDCRLVERAAGIAAMAGRRWDDAEGHFRTALRQAQTLPHRPEAAHTRRFFAQMLLERDRAGDRVHAAELIDEAAELYRQMGMPRHEAMAHELRARLA